MILINQLISLFRNQSTCATCDPSSEWLYQITDPLNNTAIDIHEYLDSDFSGSHQACTQPGPSNLAYLTSWLQQHGLKGFVSEFGGDNNTQCDTYLTDLLTYLSDNDVYIGWAAWAAGPFWGTSAPCCNDGAPLGSLEPGSVACGGGPSLYTTVWQPVIEPLLPSTLQKSGLSSLTGGTNSTSPSGGSGSGSSSSSTLPAPSSTSTKPAKHSTTTKSAKHSSTTTSVPATPTPVAGTVPEYAQCGGIGWTGATACLSPYTCHVLNSYYSQCL